MSVSKNLELERMKRWDLSSMLDRGLTLFAKIHMQKHHAHHNHDVHLLARELNDWLINGIHSLLERIIVNPIETPRGYKNPDTGIALRGPLSQFMAKSFTSSEKPGIVCQQSLNFQVVT